MLYTVFNTSAVLFTVHNASSLGEADLLTETCGIAITGSGCGFPGTHVACVQPGSEEGM